MANHYAFSLQNKLPILAGSSLFVNYSSHLTNKLNKKISGYHSNTPRRFVLGVVGFSFLSQFVNMAGNLGFKSFIASAARQKGAVEQVIFLTQLLCVLGLFVILICGFCLKFESW